MRAVEGQVLAGSPGGGLEDSLAASPVCVPVSGSGSLPESRAVATRSTGREHATAPPTPLAAIAIAIATAILGHPKLTARVIVERRLAGSPGNHARTSPRRR